MTDNGQPNDSRLRLTLPWEEIEPGTQQQIIDTLDHDWVTALAIMPDVHQGYDLPIGGVCLTDQIVSPSYVGYDIGCGMTMVRLTVGSDLAGLLTRENRESVKERVMELVPSGLGNSHQADQGVPQFISAIGDQKLTSRVNSAARRQLGTLGSGNHFIEFGESDNDGRICITVHSGSRRPGWLIGDYYMKQGKYFHLRKDMPTALAYLQDYRWASDFAKANRREILRLCLLALDLGGKVGEIILGEAIDVPHNTLLLRSESMTVLHRKGAISAERGEAGIIPGSMASGVVLTRGTGNQEYLCSSSHGAGRAMSRSKAKKSITMEEFQESTKDVIAVVNERTLDEAPAAYKDLGLVVQRQADLKTLFIRDHITPLVNVKGV